MMPMFFIVTVVVVVAEIVKKIKKPPPLIRPSVSPQSAPPESIHIMKQCWMEMPEARPTFDAIYDGFKSMSQGK